MNLPHKLIRRMSKEGGFLYHAVIHPETEAELGRIVPVGPEGYQVILPDRSTGACDVRYPHTQPTVYTAKLVILEHHEQRAS